MIAALKKQVVNFMLEILLVITGAVGSILWTINAAQAAQNERINGLEKQMEIIRIENKTDHDKILDILLRK